MDEIPQVIQVPVENTPPDKPVKKLNLRSILDVGSWVALFILTPAFFIAMFSQNALPGDFLYPVKRGIENTLIAAASVNPATKAVLLADISDRRFTEADTLLLSQANIEPLNDLIAQVESSEVAIDNVSDPKKQEELTAKVIAQIEDYQAKLTSTAAKIESSPSPFAQTPTQTQAQTAVQISPSPTQAITTAPVVTSTLTPTQTQITSAPQQGTTTAAPTPTQQVSLVTASPPAATPLIGEQKKQVEEAVEVTKLKLEKVKKDLEEKREERKSKENQGGNSGKGKNSSKDD
ncbi:MAG: DUF5667 domain-containing protein [Candidatus Levyibacteriota bacterium]